MATNLSEGKMEAPAERAQCDQSANEGREEKEREPIQQLLTGHGGPVPGTPASAMLTPIGRVGPARSGPKTARGKASVAGNALGHGILAKAQGIPGVEGAEDWDAH